MVDPAARGSDTLSTHALMRGAVNQLERWGLADDLLLHGPLVDAEILRFITDEFRSSGDRTRPSPCSPDMTPPSSRASSR